MSLFGQTNTAFDSSELLKLAKQRNIEAVKKYINTYFLKSGLAKQMLFWIPENEGFEIIDDSVAKSRYITKDIVVLDDDNVWKADKWFFGSQVPSYIPCMKVNKDRVFKGEKGTNYINFFPEMLHGKKELKQLQDYPEEVRTGVNRMWDHIRIVWCSGKADQFTYVQTWIAHMISGRKLKTVINIRSEKGIGKSMVTEFLLKNVLGHKLVYSTSDSNILSGRFNGPLMGTMLFVLEEAPCASVGDWKVLDSKLKNFITEPYISIEKKMKDQINLENTVSFMFFSNKNSVVYTTDERRYFSPDTSSEKKGDRDYFVKLADEVVNNSEVGEAFYFDCLRIAKENPKWHEQFDMPVSDENIRNTSDNAPSLIQFIKDEFVTQKTGIDMKSATFYESYKFYCTRNKITHPTKKGLAMGQLKELGINYMPASTKHHNQNWISNTFDELYKIFKLKKLIHETDDIVVDDTETDEETKETKLMLCIQEARGKLTTTEEELDILNGTPQQPQQPPQPLVKALDQDLIECEKFAAYLKQRNIKALERLDLIDKNKLKPLPNEKGFKINDDDVVDLFSLD